MQHIDLTYKADRLVKHPSSKCFRISTLVQSKKSFLRLYIHANRLFESEASQGQAPCVITWIMFRKVTNTGPKILVDTPFNLENIAKLQIL